jgi:hypothetical protein
VLPVERVPLDRLDEDDVRRADVVVRRAVDVDGAREDANLFCGAYPASVGEIVGFPICACEASARSFFNASSTAGPRLRPHAAAKTAAGTSSITVNFRIERLSSMRGPAGDDELISTRHSDT